MTEGTVARGPTTEARGGRARLAETLQAQADRLLPCVHCGFCLPACPTYNRLGDEADSPRGRLHLMGAVVEGRLDPASDAFQTHIDRCLGCRACEPVCPSGVEYGTLLEAARETAAEARRPALLTRALLTVMASRRLRRPFFLLARMLRATGLAGLATRVLPGRGVGASARLSLAMLDATRGWVPSRAAAGSPAPVVTAPAGRAAEDPSGRDPTRRAATADRSVAASADGSVAASAAGASYGAASYGGVEGGPERGTVALLLGCVQEGLYERVNQATIRTLEANGYRVQPVAGQECCGALHAHAGSLRGARRLARANIETFEAAGVDFVVANAAGCGAAMKDYDVLFEADAGMAGRATAFAERVRDVTELLAAAGPREGAAVPVSVAYDHPCHLLHAQGVARPPIQVLEAVPGVEVRVVDDAEECCGGAGIYGLTHPDLGGRIGRDKVDAVEKAGAGVACSANPGCMMQIGAGLRLDGSSRPVVHPVEILDESYERAGFYA